MTIRAVAFDLDGTLAEFNLDYKTMRAEVTQLLINKGFPASIFSKKESLFEILEKAKIYMRNNGKTEQELSSIQDLALSIARKHELIAARETTLLPGVFETLKALKKMNLKLAIFTINSKEATDYILDSFNLRQFFNVIVTRETVSKVKPDPSHLAFTLKALTVEAEEVVVVGDSIADMNSAKALNALAVGLVTGGSGVKKLNSKDVEQKIKSITDLPTLITKLKNNEP